MQILSSPLRSGHIGIKDVQCAETYEKTIYDFFCEISLKILKKLWKITKQIFVLADAQYSETDAIPIFKFLRYGWFLYWNL